MGRAASPARRAAPQRPPWGKLAGAAALLPVLLAAAGTRALPRPGLPAGSPAWDGGAARVAAAPARYDAGRLHRALLGDGYRDLWGVPVRVEVLDLARFAGGLRPVRPGGGKQTRSLHLRGADGREYVFRSVDKDQAVGLGPLHRAILGRIRQDQVGALLPGAALLAGSVEEAAGVLHPERRLAVMPDDPALGDYRAGFGGLLGVLEEHPRDGEDGAPGFAGSRKVVGTDGLLEELAEHPRDRVDPRAFLAARLVDVYLGDWDRHEDQWRWARLERGGGRVWLPIPRDRDYALSDYRGALPALARLVDPKVVRFDAGYRDLDGLLVKARPLDRRLLCALPAAAWDSTALALRAALGDAALDTAVRRMPPEYVRLRGAALLATLRARRDRLPDAARRFRRSLHADGGCAAPAR